MNKLADEVGMRFINQIQSNLIGQNYQPWYKCIIINDEYLSEVINSCPIILMLRQVILKCTITSLKVSLQANAKLTAKLIAKLETLFEKLLMIYTEHWRKRELFLSNLHEPSTWWYIPQLSST